MQTPAVGLSSQLPGSLTICFIITDLFLFPGVLSYSRPALWRTLSSTNKLKRNLCHSSRDRKCPHVALERHRHSCTFLLFSLTFFSKHGSAMQTGYIQVWRGPIIKAQLASKVLPSLSFPPRMQRIRSKQQKYRDGHQTTSEESQQSQTAGRKQPSHLSLPRWRHSSGRICVDSQQVHLTGNPLLTF